MKPLAIDLFCGLLQAQFVLRTDAAVEKLVAGRTKNPDHMRLSVRSKSPSSIALMRWPVCNLKNTIFTARLTRTRHFGPSTRKSVKCHIFEVSFLFVEWAAFLVFACRPNAPKFARSLIGAFHRTISLVRVGWNNIKMFAAFSAIPAILRRTFMLISPNAASPLGAVVATPLLVGFGCFKGCSTQLTS